MTDEESKPDVLSINDMTARECIECGSIVVLNYTVSLGKVYCPKCASLEAAE